MRRGEQEQREEEDEEQRDDDEVPVNLGAAREAHPGHGDEPKGGGKGDLDGNGMDVGLGRARAWIRRRIGDVLRVFRRLRIEAALRARNMV
jgi:hypothetical protein